MSKIYLVGPAGAGKTSRLVAGLAKLIGDNVRPDRILVLVPQKAQSRVFRTALAQIRGNFRARGEPTITTIYGLAQQHVGLFFPLIAERAGFAHPHREPVSLNVEAAQYFLDRIVEPRIADFDDLKLFRPRLLGQILDSMNKAAECGFPLDEIAARLSAAWSGDPQRLVSYRRVQDVALAFRRYCLQNSLLDFSLQIETFAHWLLLAPSYRDYIAARYRHVLADNLEENPPVMHDFVGEVLKTCDTALLAEDSPGGYRIFLGADVDSARTLRGGCDEVVMLDHSYTASPAMAAFGAALRRQFEPAAQTAPSAQDKPGAGMRDALGDAPGSARYWTGMVDWVVEHIRELIGQGAQPRDIAVLAPYVEDVLRFELQERLRPDGVRVRAVRPSRPLYDHPVVRMLVTFTRLAHPEWDEFVAASDLARALAVAVADLDVSRAQLIADAALRASTRRLAPLEDQALWQRVGMRFYEPYAILQRWLEDGRRKSEVRDERPEARSKRQDTETEPTVKRQTSEERGKRREEVNGQTLEAEVKLAEAAPLDLYWQTLFTDVLSQAGFGLNEDLDGALVCDKLIQSARGFREVFERAPYSAGAEGSALDIGREYIKTLGEDILAAQYAPEREPDIADDNAVLVAPAHTYLVSNFRSRYQFWLDINSQGWYERVYQPLTHPYVLSRRWSAGRIWTEEDEHRARQDMLGKLLSGLTYRCADKVFVVSSQLSISGDEESGPLARAIQKVIGRRD
ncbi:MAG: hypothetical protein M1434_09210 [Chloroflexi bacterium]|nr:hypothetical protein [Chloroflexota bacterium]